MCVCRCLCLCAWAHKWKTRVTAKNAKGNPRRQKRNKENGKRNNRKLNQWWYGEKLKQLETFLLGEIEEEVTNRNGETESRYYLEEHYGPTSFYILWTAITLLEINPVIMTLACKILISIFLVPKIIWWLLHKCTCKGISWNCFPDSSEHLTTRNRLKIRKSLTWEENIILYNHNVSSSKFKLYVTWITTISCKDNHCLLSDEDEEVQTGYL